MKRASLRAIAAALLSMLAAIAPAAADSPFAPPPQAAPAFIRLLAFADYFDPRALEEFERQTGWRIAYDAYDAPDSIPARLRQGAYDLVVLPGPVLSRQIAAGTLRKLDRARLPHAADVAPAIAAKLAAYDPGGQIAEPYMWFASGLLYDADRAPRRLGAPPTSWSAIFAPEQMRRLADCGLATLDSRDDLFMAAWRYLGANPARLTFAEIRRAAELLIRLKAAAPSFAIADVAGALANGSACLAFGRGPDAARAAARAASRGASSTFALSRRGKARRCRSTPWPSRPARRIQPRPTRCSTICCARTLPPATRARPACRAAKIPAMRRP
jgi:putrescine transport system substrate-binding protein